ncbi:MULTISPECIES: transporter substrate-binding domain-containing protein [unclassified Streptococcus]|uniref:transporter substrate-binding domain-containing protein n=1 Tax=unclassified Streptococcus TaxID=2608887 RepID=UPI001071CA0A|nr:MULTISPECIES: transporter substrate-binding domain-containing protein [unclassified Streptococcus]MBF0806423.1 transporter substrate-binding domain-containing protein [Streptococcus sp. 19428wA2_WM07]TFU27947.1 transporter substrate-binding domain-containing protein [Streptococcus sp. WM07]
MKLMKCFNFLVGFFLTLLFFSSSVTATDLPDQIQKIKDSGTLRVGVKQDVPNFGYLDPQDNQYHGMEIDIAKKIAQELGVKIEYTPVTSHTREPLMDNGQVDLIIATYTITPQRQESYAISTPYYYDQIGFLVNQKSGIQNPKNLDGKTIGVTQGSTTKTNLQAFAKENNLSFNFVELGSFPELAISLYAQRIDAFSVDKSILSGYTSKQTKILNQGFNTQEYGIASKKSNNEFISYINVLIEKWTKDGSLKKIQDTYNLKSALPTEN